MSTVGRGLLPSILSRAGAGSGGSLPKSPLPLPCRGPTSSGCSPGCSGLPASAALALSLAVSTHSLSPAWFHVEA